jgi:preprotein translocase subunit SecF
VSFRSTLSDIYNERTHFDFVGPKRRWFALSGAVILIGLVSLATRGLTFGIDFEGGTAWQVKKEARPPSSGAVRDVLRPLDLADAKILIVGGDSVRVSFERVDRAKQDEVREALARYAGVRAESVSITDVGPTWGAEVSRKAVRALIFFFLAIAAYLSWRFEPKMALAAIVAVVHDIFVTVGVYSLVGFEVTPATVIAFLTILGFSLYDTVVVFDKVAENVAGLATAGRETYSDVVNRSMNDVLMRSLNTSIVAILPVLSLLVVGAYVFGALTIRDFALALFVGLITGAYSSIFVATPFLAVLKEREPRYTALRQRLAKTAAGGPAPAFAGVPAGAPSAAEAGEPVAAPSAPAPRRTAPGRPAPRPRQKRRRR